ncbi:MAG: TIGR02285 family protein [Magnetococcales bacterium]|nr:TIGR02285 family protein [Magnetococcales bacterium]
MAEKRLLHSVMMTPWVILCALLLTPAPLQAQDDSTLIWLRDNLPPAFIQSGPEKDQGIVDGVVSMLMTALPQYQHRVKNANMARILHMIKQKRPVCYAGFLKTPEREQYITFSRANLLTMQNGIIIAKAHRGDRFEQGQAPLSLATLLGRADLIPGLIRGRSYGASIDRLLKERAPVQTLYRTEGNALEGILKMLDVGRIDYSLGFPWEAPYVAKRIGLNHKFSILPIEENYRSRWVKNYIGCPKTPWGIKTIHHIQEALNELMPSETYMHHQLKWFPREMELEIRAAFRRLLLKPGRSGNEASPP